jgi:hypothetical protein
MTLTRAPFPKHRVVAVLWDDAHCQPDAEMCQPEALRDGFQFWTIGFVVRESEDSVWLSPECSEDNDVRKTTRVPKRWILETRELTRKRPTRRKQDQVQTEAQQAAAP